jgi:hypothetical protein
MGEVCLLGHHVLAEPEHHVADRDVGHARSNLVNDTRALHAEPGGKAHVLERAILAFAALPVGRVHARGTNPDPDFAGAGMWRFDIDDMKHVGAAILVKLNCLHHRAPTISWHRSMPTDTSSPKAIGDCLGDAGRTMPMQG